MNDTDWMQEAFKEAKNAYDLGEVPVGAVVVKDGEIIHYCLFVDDELVYNGILNQFVMNTLIHIFYLVVVFNRTILNRTIRINPNCSIFFYRTMFFNKNYSIIIKLKAVKENCI